MLIRIRYNTKSSDVANYNSYLKKKKNTLKLILFSIRKLRRHTAGTYLYKK